MCTFWNQLLWSNKFGLICSKWLVSMATTQNLGCQKINTNLAISFLSCNIERHMGYKITALPEFYNMDFQNVKIHLHFKFASLSGTKATAIVVPPPARPQPTPVGQWSPRSWPQSGPPFLKIKFNMYNLVSLISRLHS